ncbi:hypothetical protein MRX96_030749 [Rhipicephalus microplus]
MGAARELSPPAARHLGQPVRVRATRHTVRCVGLCFRSVRTTSVHYAVAASPAESSRQSHLAMTNGATYRGQLPARGSPIDTL